MVLTYEERVYGYNLLHKDITSIGLKRDPQKNLRGDCVGDLVYKGNGSFSWRVEVKDSIPRLHLSVEDEGGELESAHLSKRAEWDEVFKNNLEYICSTLGWEKTYTKSMEGFCSSSPDGDTLTSLGTIEYKKIVFVPKK